MASRSEVSVTSNPEILSLRVACAVPTAKFTAVELRIFPESMRGLGEGQRPWDVKPEGVMTNATVGTVSQTTAGGIVHVTYKAANPNTSLDQMSRCWPMSWRIKRY